MKKALLIIIVLILGGCTGTSTSEKKITQEFLSDLASENNRLEADLYLDVFNGDLSTLTYDYYLTYITKNEAPSAKGFSAIVKSADYHFFRAQKEKFILALLYKDEKKLICDDSHTAFVDSCLPIINKIKIPELSDFAKKWIK